MTKLEAVNRILRATHEYPFAALDTGGVSTAARAETMLDEHDKLVQGEGWHCNKEVDVTLETADTTKVATAIAAGAWTAATKTLTKVAAFAGYSWASGDQISVTGGTGVTVAWYEIASRTSDDAIILKEAISAADNADTTTDIIGWEDALVVGSDVLRMDSYSASASTDVVLRNGMLYDRDDNTFSFDDDMTVAVVRQLDFTHLSEALQALVVADAAVSFQESEIAGEVKDRALRDKAIRARMAARREEQKVAQLNILDTAHAQRMQGQSHVTYPTRR